MLAKHRKHQLRHLKVCKYSDKEVWGVVAPSKNREVMKHWSMIQAARKSCSNSSLSAILWVTSLEPWCLQPETIQILPSTSKKEKGWKRCKWTQEADNAISKRALQHTVTISSSKTFSVCLWLLQVSCLLHFVQRARMGRFSPSIDIHIGQVYGWKNDNTYPAPG